MTTGIQYKCFCYYHINKQDNSVCSSKWRIPFLLEQNSDLYLINNTNKPDNYCAYLYISMLQNQRMLLITEIIIHT